MIPGPNRVSTHSAGLCRSAGPWRLATVADIRAARSPASLHCTSDSDSRPSCARYAPRAMSRVRDLDKADTASVPWDLQTQLPSHRLFAPGLLPASPRYLCVVRGYHMWTQKCRDWRAMCSSEEGDPRIRRPAAPQVWPQRRQRPSLSSPATSTRSASAEYE
eukprot:scaffold1220_cov259-Pinguiococcus_pyrenoidosus.AAC.14